LGLDFFYDVPRSHSDTPQLVGLLWSGNGPTQRPLPDNTHTHTRERERERACVWERETSMHATGFEPTIPANEWRRPTLQTDGHWNCRRRKISAIHLRRTLTWFSPDARFTSRNRIKELDFINEFLVNCFWNLLNIHKPKQL
jgi:hypothetical protein